MKAETSGVILYLSAADCDNFSCLLADVFTAEAHAAVANNQLWSLIFLFVPLFRLRIQRPRSAGMGVDAAHVPVWERCGAAGSCRKVVSFVRVASSIPHYFF